MIDALKLIISLALCFLAAVVGSVFTTPAIPVWYAALAKPPFSPPNWLFGPVWTLLYALMGISAYLVWRKGLGDAKVRVALSVFIVQLVLNSIWSIAFFGLRSPMAGFVVIVALWLAILMTIVKFKELSMAASVLLVPYILWVSFAAVLNLSIWILNY